MNSAKKFLHSVNSDMPTMDYNDALEFAYEMFEVVDQENTTFELNDGSLIKFDGIAQKVFEA